MRKTAFDDLPGSTITEKEVMLQREEYVVNIRKSILSNRLFAWNVHFILICLTLILIYPSQYLLTFQHYAVGTGTEEKPDNPMVISFLRTTIYYMFMGGIYHDSNNDNGEIGPTPSYLQQTWGYLLILAFSLLERICLQWLQDRFGCTDEVFDQINTLEKRLKDIEEELTKIEIDVFKHRACMRQLKKNKSQLAIRRSNSKFSSIVEEPLDMPSSRHGSNIFDRSLNTEDEFKSTTKEIKVLEARIK